MRYKPGQKEQTRDRIIEAAGRSFRKGGYSGIGVDGLAKEAGVTSGAFYGHFNSKLSAFEASITDGLDELKSAIASFQQEHGENWWQEFAKFYTGQKRTCDLADSCTLQSLTPEIARSDETIRALFETKLGEIVELASKQTSHSKNQSSSDTTLANLAMLVGGVTLARAVNNQEFAEDIAAAVRKAIALGDKAE